MKKSIAFFDFDGTITSKDTMLELIKFHFGNRAFIWGLMRNSIWIAGMKSGILSHQFAKEKLLTTFFKDMSEQKFQSICTGFSKDYLPLIIRRDALKKIEDYVDSETEVVVVTASATDWVKPWCDKLNIDCIASNLEIVNGKLTGKLIGINCNYQEKVLRIKSKFDLNKYDLIYCYGDSSGDKEMLKLSTNAFYRPFRQK